MLRAEPLPSSLRRLLQVVRHLPKMDDLPPRLGRLVFALGAAVSRPLVLPPAEETVHRVGPHRCIVREFCPPGLAADAPALLYLHGGGWTVGSSASFRPLCRILAHVAGCRVYALDYRLAPEHPFPAGLNDCLAAWTWLVRRRGRTLIAIGGDSAGAQLATVLCRRMRDSHKRVPDAQFLIYPATTWAADTPSSRDYADGYFLTRPLMHKFINHYLGSKGDHDRSHPDLSPLLTPDLSGMPPAYIGVAGHDILRDEGIAYAEKLQAAGVPVTLDIHSDMVHGFVNLLAFSAPLRSVQRCAEQLKSLLAARTSP